MSHTNQPIAAMGIDEIQSSLINAACTGAVGPIAVKELDKGLSGAKVLLAQWPLEAETTSALHVLKIQNAIDKLEWEINRIESVVAPVDPQIGHVKLFKEAKYGLLRQAFIGSPDGELVSLRNWFDSGPNVDQVRQRIVDIFDLRMRQWHCRPRSSPPIRRHTFEEMFERRTSRISDLPTLLDQIGKDALAESFDRLSALRLAPLQDIVTQVQKLQTSPDEFPIGLTHGDLHSQNILLGVDQTIHLIDFAWAGYRWKAVDYLMLECSLKFLVAPLDARDEDLIEMERLVEDGSEASKHFPSLERRLHGEQLRVFAAALFEIRKQATAHQAILNFEQYRRGLVVLMACLATFPKLNRTYLAHSLAYHAARL